MSRVEALIEILDRNQHIGMKTYVSNSASVHNSNALEEKAPPEPPEVKLKNTEPTELPVSRTPETFRATRRITEE